MVVFKPTFDDNELENFSPYFFRQFSVFILKENKKFGPKHVSMIFFHFYFLKNLGLQNEKKKK